MNECPLRPELEALPSRMKTLRVDKRGYVVPWFVDWIDGEPEFRAMNLDKWVRAVREKLCWVCGERMGRYMTFVAGPMCGINRTTSEPPAHQECARWSARNCPFLNNPEAIRRVDEKMNTANVSGFMIQRNPGVAMLWTTKDFTVFPDGKGGVLITMGEPETVEWYCRGRLATREEVEESVNSGLPVLVSVASREEGGLKYLNEQRERFQRYLP
jgi:hypothetical protein